MEQGQQESFGRLLLRYRNEVAEKEDQSFSAERLAHAIGVSANTIRGYEKGEPKSGPRPDYVARLAAVFAKRLDWDEATREVFIAASRPPKVASRPPMADTIVPDAYPEEESSLPAADTGISHGHSEEEIHSVASDPTVSYAGWATRGRSLRAQRGSVITGAVILAAVIGLSVAWAIAAGRFAQAPPVTTHAWSAPGVVPASVRATLPPVFPGYTLGVASASTCAPFGCVVYRIHLIKYFEWNKRVGKVYGVETSPHCPFTLGRDVGILIHSCRVFAADDKQDHEYAIVVYTITRGVHTAAPLEVTRYLQVDYRSDGETSTSQGAATP